MSNLVLQNSLAEKGVMQNCLMLPNIAQTFPESSFLCTSHVASAHFEENRHL